MTTRGPQRRATRLSPLAVAVATALAFGAACAAPPAPVPGPPPVDHSTPAGYQELLDGVDRDLAGALATIARTPAAGPLDERVLNAAGVASAAAERLTSGPVPAAAVEENTTLADGLRELGRELGYLGQRIHQRAICAGPAAVDAISTAPSLSGLREVAADLATAEDGRPAFRWGASLPPPTDVPEHRLPNATLVTDRRGGAGDGVLEVRNEGGRDAVVTLARDRAVVVALAVTAGMTARVDGIPDGEYRLWYTTGRGWDASLGTFNRQCDFRRFVEPTVLRSTPVPGGTAYTVQTVTLRDRPEPDPDAPVPEPGPDALVPEPGRGVPEPEPGPDAPVPQSRPDAPVPGSRPDAPVPEPGRDAPVPGSRPDAPVPEPGRDMPVPPPGPDADGTEPVSPGELPR